MSARASYTLHGLLLKVSCLSKSKIQMRDGSEQLWRAGQLLCTLDLLRVHITYAWISFMLTPSQNWHKCDESVVIPLKIFHSAAGRACKRRIRSIKKCILCIDSSKKACSHTSHNHA